MADRVTRKELAERWGVAPESVNKLVRAGRLVVGDDKRIDVNEAEAVRSAMNPNNRAKEAEAKELGGQRADTQNAAHPMVRARLAKEVLAVKVKELQFKQMTGELIGRAELKVQLFEAGRAVNSALKVWPPRLSGEIASLQGLPPREFQKQVRALLEREVRTIVSDLTVALESIAASDQRAA
ncbi:MAG: hypothetical protein AB7O57_03305 [Hyphomicrobiaceae bacterium]